MGRGNPSQTYIECGNLPPTYWREGITPGPPAGVWGEFPSSARRFFHSSEAKLRRSNTNPIRTPGVAGWSPATFVWIPTDIMGIWDQNLFGLGPSSPPIFGGPDVRLQADPHLGSRCLKQRDSRPDPLGPGGPVGRCTTSANRPLTKRANLRVSGILSGKNLFG